MIVKCIRKLHWEYSKGLMITILICVSSFPDKKAKKKKSNLFAYLQQQSKHKDTWLFTAYLVKFNKLHWQKTSYSKLAKHGSAIIIYRLFIITSDKTTSCHEYSHWNDYYHDYLRNIITLTLFALKLPTCVLYMMIACILFILKNQRPIANPVESFGFERFFTRVLGSAMLTATLWGNYTFCLILYWPYFLTNGWKFTGVYIFRKEILCKIQCWY